MFEKRLNKLKIIYGIAFAFIALTLLATSFLMQYSIQQNDGDSRLINLSGRQRMICQRLVKCVLALEHSSSKTEHVRWLQEIKVSLADFKSYHHGLQRGDERLELPATEKSTEIRMLFAEISTHYSAITTALEDLLSHAAKYPADRKIYTVTADKVLAAESGFLDLMDKITFQFDKEAKQRIASMQQMEWIFLLTGLLVLVVEFYFVFRPSISQQNSLMTSLKAKSQQLRETNKRLQDALKTSLETNRALRRLSKTDGLLQIANRRHFDEVMLREWRRAVRGGQPLSLMILDIDHFKLYNDEYGHLEGDNCLKRVASVISLSFRRPADLVARYGGEEFAVIMPETEPANAFRLAEHIRENIEKLGIPHKASPTAEHVTISIGISSMLSQQGSTPAPLIHAADEALYDAKQSGRNCIRTANISI